jgi:hypothetical protein
MPETMEKREIGGGRAVFRDLTGEMAVKRLTRAVSAGRSGLDRRDRRPYPEDRDVASDFRHR